MAHVCVIAFNKLLADVCSTTAVRGLANRLMTPAGTSLALLLLIAVLLSRLVSSAARADTDAEEEGIRSRRLRPPLIRAGRIMQRLFVELNPP